VSLSSRFQGSLQMDISHLDMINQQTNFFCFTLIIAIYHAVVLDRHMPLGCFPYVQTLPLLLCHYLLISYSVSLSPWDPTETAASAGTSAADALWCSSLLLFETFKAL